MGSTINDKCCRFTIVDNPNDKWMNHTIVSTTYIYERDSMYTIIVWGYACCRNGKLITQCIYISYKYICKLLLTLLLLFLFLLLLLFNDMSNGKYV